MDAPNFAKPLGKGEWIGTEYIVHRCPLCSAENTLVFTSHGYWKCNSCRPEAIGNLKEFKSKLRSKELYKEIADFMGEPSAPEGLIVLSEYRNIDNIQYRIGTGFSPLDKLLGGLGTGALTVITGKRGEGKSTFAGQLALNAIQYGGKVCFYSGELNAGMFQTWIFAQAAGEKYIEESIDKYGATRYSVVPIIEERIRSWLGDSLILYDNTISKSSEKNSILERFLTARLNYGCTLFFVDNLMTAKYGIDRDKDYFRAQANFAGQLLDFAHEQGVHVVLVAHPRKGDSGDINDDVSGSSDITNKASNVIRVKKSSFEERMNKGCDSIITVSKNRDYGHTGNIRFNFIESSRRFVAVDGTTISKFGWE